MKFQDKNWDETYEVKNPEILEDALEYFLDFEFETEWFEDKYEYDHTATEVVNWSLGDIETIYEVVDENGREGLLDIASNIFIPDATYEDGVVVFFFWDGVSVRWSVAETVEKAKANALIDMIEDKGYECRYEEGSDYIFVSGSVAEMIDEPAYWNLDTDEFAPEESDDPRDWDNNGEFFLSVFEINGKGEIIISISDFWEK